MNQIHRISYIIPRIVLGRTSEDHTSEAFEVNELGSFSRRKLFINPVEGFRQKLVEFVGLT